jgi:hypothetical protein
MVTMLGVLMKPMVSPSGRARASSAQPISPPAPARLFTTMVWPRPRSMKRASVRAATSVPPPGAKATIIVTGRSGCQAGVVEPWARTAGAASRAGAARTRRRVVMKAPASGEG